MKTAGRLVSEIVVIILTEVNKKITLPEQAIELSTLENVEEKIKEYVRDNNTEVVRQYAERIIEKIKADHYCGYEPHNQVIDTIIDTIREATITSPAKEDKP